MLKYTIEGTVILIGILLSFLSVFKQMEQIYV